MLDTELQDGRWLGALFICDDRMRFASLCGLFAHLGDPDPRAPHEMIEAENRFYWALFLGGVVAIVVAMWLAGFGYSEAKIRSAVVAAVAVAPLIGLGVWVTLWQGENEEFFGRLLTEAV